MSTGIIYINTKLFTPCKVSLTNIFILPPSPFSPSIPTRLNPPHPYPSPKVKWKWRYESCGLCCLNSTKDGVFQSPKRAGGVESTPYAFIPEIMDRTLQKRREIICRGFPITSRRPHDYIC